MPEQSIIDYYDQHAKVKLRKFLNGNARLERAWQSIARWSGSESPQHVLEIGCGIGETCWRMAKHWDSAKIVGLDISPLSIDIAVRLFATDRLTFCEGVLEAGQFDNQFDLIVMLDVYEHIPAAERQHLHGLIRALLRPGARILLTFPTPRHLSWLRENRPAEIQPVDEDIHPSTILRLAEETGSEILLYEEVDVWRGGDYVHVVLAHDFRFGDRTVDINLGRSNGLTQHFVKWRESRKADDERRSREKLVKERLGWIDGGTP